MDRGEGRKKERERNVNVWLPLTCPALGTRPATQVCALTVNQTCGPLVLRLALNPLNHTSQGCLFFLLFPCLGFHIILSLKNISALVSVTQWIECQPANQRVACSIPSHGTCLGCRPGPLVGGLHEATNRCISRILMFFSLSFSLSSPL